MTGTLRGTVLTCYPHFNLLYQGMSVTDTFLSQKRTGEEEIADTKNLREREKAQTLVG